MAIRKKETMTPNSQDFREERTARCERGAGRLCTGPALQPSLTFAAATVATATNAVEFEREAMLGIQALLLS